MLESFKGVRSLLFGCIAWNRLVIGICYGVEGELAWPVDTISRREMEERWRLLAHTACLVT
jgi:hypothetical protein